MRIHLIFFTVAATLLASCETAAAVSSSTQDSSAVFTASRYSPDAESIAANKLRFLRVDKVVKESDEDNEGEEDKTEEDEDDQEEDEERMVPASLPAMGGIKNLKALERSASSLVHRGATPKSLKEWLELAKLPRSDPKWATFSEFRKAHKSAHPEQYATSLLRKVLQPKTSA